MAGPGRAEGRLAGSGLARPGRVPSCRGAGRVPAGIGRVTSAFAISPAAGRRDSPTRSD
jgi:hypothetical protein